MADTIHTLAEFVHGMSVKTMPADIVHECKRQTLDALTCAVGSLRVPGGVTAARAGVKLGGRGEATIIGMADKVSASSAAFANAQMSNSLDLTVNLMNSQGLGGIIVFPALALAETLGAPGSRVVEAIACGFEVAARVRRSLPPRTSFAANEPLPHWTIFGATASAAKLLDLPVEQIEHSLALAGMSTLPKNPRGPNGMSKWVLIGNLAALGITAATLASEGFTGDVGYLDDENGFWRSVGTTRHNGPALTERLGDLWWMRELYFKRVPAGTPNQPALHSVGRIVQRNGIAPEDIEQIEITRGLGMEQLFQVARPDDYIGASFSLPFQIGAIAAGVPPRNWATALANPLVVQIAETVRLRRDEKITAEIVQAQKESDGTLSWWWFSNKSHVRVRAKGKDYEMWSEYERLSDDEVSGKFSHYATDLLTPQEISRAIELVMQLDRLDRVGPLTSLWGRPIAAAPV